MRKILFAIDSLSGGGAERVITSLANQLSVFGENVSIVLTYGTKIEYKVRDEITIYNIHGEVLSHEIAEKMNKEKFILSDESISKNQKLFLKERKKLAESREFYKKSRELKKIIEEKQIDVVISFLTNTNMLVGAIAKRVRAKTIISERSDPNQTVFNLENGNKIVRLYKRVDVLVCQTEQAWKSYPDTLQSKGRVIGNPIKDGLPERFTGERKKKIVTFGRLEPPKNLELLIEAFKEIHVEYPDYTLWLYGNGSQREKLYTQIQEMKLSNVVHIEDFKQNIHEIIRDSAMYVSTSNYEGISNSMLEALAIGLPTICTDCPVGGAKEVINDSVNGFLVPIKDKEKLIDAMKKVISNPHIQEKLSEQAIKIRDDLSIEKITKKWLEIID